METPIESNWNMYSTVFWQNELEDDLWYAIPREKYIDFFAKGDRSVSISSKDINTLIELINKPDLLASIPTYQTEK